MTWCSRGRSTTGRLRSWPARVEAVFQRSTPLLDLRVGGRVIRTTAEHPFWVERRGWTEPAQQLMAGDRLLSHDGRSVVLDGVEGSRDVPVFNMPIADDHTYFVGSNEWGFSVWAHNASYPYPPTSPACRNWPRS